MTSRGSGSLTTDPLTGSSSARRPTLVNDLGIWGLALLAGVGSFKVVPFIAALPVDATIVAIALTLLGIAVALSRSGLQVRKAILAPVLLWASMYPSLFPTALEGESLQKIGLLFGVLFLCTIAPIVLFNSLRDIRLFLLLVAIQGGIQSAGALWSFGAEGTLRAGAFGGSVLHAAQLGGALLLISISISFRQRQWRLFALLIAGIALVAVAGTGTRAALFGIVLTIAVGLSMSRSTVVARLRRFAIGASVLLGAWLIAVRVAPGRALSRISGLIANPDQDVSSLLRVEALRVSFEGALGAPFGRGVGSFSAVWTENVSPRYFGHHLHYPHNLIAETAIELGWVPTVLMLAVLGLAITRARDASAHPLGEIVLLLLIYTLLQSFTRGAITDQRLLFSIVGCAIVLPQLLRADSGDLGLGAAEARSG
jgi:O-antigen ligase